VTSFPWQRNEVTQALRDRLLAPGAVTDGFHGVDVLPALPGEPVERPEAAGSLVVLFRWKLDPAVYAVHFHLEPAEYGEETDLPPGVSTGVPVASLQGWVSEVVLWLMEELDTGLVRRSTRTQVGDVVLLRADGNTVDVLPEGYYIGDVHLGSGRSNGDHLQRDGLHTQVARRLLRQDRLLVWLHAHVDNARGEPFVGHAVVSRPVPTRTADELSGSARLEVLEVVPGTPTTVNAALAYHAVRSAIEMGAEQVATDLDDPFLTQVGFRRSDGASQVVHWNATQAPHTQSIAATD
jgi:hypothetical protein